MKLVWATLISCFEVRNLLLAHINSKDYYEVFIGDSQLYCCQDQPIHFSAIVAVASDPHYITNIFYLLAHFCWWWQQWGEGFFRNLNALLFFYMPLSSLNSLKVEMEKMTNEKGEMHRHYIMVFICYIYFLNTHNCKCIALQIWPCLYKAFLVLPQ